MAQETSYSATDLAMQAYFPSRPGDELGEVEKLNREALAAIDRKDWETAAGYLREAMAADPEKVDTYLSYVAFHKARKEYPSSEKAVLKAIEVDPGNARAHYEYSQILTIKGDLGQAMAEAEKATSLSGEGDWITWAWKAKLLEQDGQKTRELSALETAVEELRTAIKLLQGRIYRYESQGEITHLIEESDIVNTIGGGFQEVDVAYYETRPSEAPEEWRLNLDRLEKKLVSLEAQLQALKN